MDGIQNKDNKEHNTSKEIESKNIFNENHQNNSSKILQKFYNNDNSQILKTNKKIFDNFIPESIIKSQKRYSNIETLGSNFKFVSNKKITAKPLKINDQDYYRNFFMLTYQAIKLNSENLEIFENVI